MIIKLLVALLVPATVLFWVLARGQPGNPWVGAAQIMALLVTLVMLAVVWVQLAMQTVAAVVNAAQHETIRGARKTLFDAEASQTISALVCSSDSTRNKWKDEWKKAADQVCQNWNTVAYLLRIDPVAKALVRDYIAKTRRSILVSHQITYPRIEERRDQAQGGQKDIWDDFDWLAKAAVKDLQDGEAAAWKLTRAHLSKLQAKPSALP